MPTTLRGKWSDPGVPHKGWGNVDVDDLGEPSFTCEMCEFMVIRYVHHMEHPDHPDPLRVGCVCAMHMSEDYVGPRLREKALRDRARRRKTWGKRSWYRIIDEYRNLDIGADLNSEGFHVQVIKAGDGRGWQIIVTHRKTRKQWPGNKRFASEDAAKNAALDALLWAKTQV